MIAVTGESVFLDIGYKTEGIIPLADFQSAGETVKAGDKIPVSIKGRDPEGYYELSRIKVERPKDWSSLEKAFADKAAIAGVVTAVVKGGVSVDVGVRAFMPASRSGAKDAAEMEKLVGQEIRCRIIKLDVADEDVVVDRRAVLEEEERAAKDRRYTEIKEGETVQGTVRSLTDYGAFVDIGGVDALLHVADISWGRVNKPADVLDGRAADRSQGAQGGRRQAAHFARHEAASAAPVGPGQREVQGRRSRHRRGHPRDRFRRLRGAREGHRGADSPVRNVLVEEGAEAGGRGETGRAGGSHGPGREPGRPAHFAGSETGAGRPVGRSAAEVPGGRGGGGSGHQPDQVRRVRAAGRGRRGHDPRRRHQRGAKGEGASAQARVRGPRIGPTCPIRRSASTTRRTCSRWGRW